jgi:hypothetical protein
MDVGDLIPGDVGVELEAGAFDKLETPRLWGVAKAGDRPPL